MTGYPYPALCTGCYRYTYADEHADPCPICFPGMTRDEVYGPIDDLIEEVCAELGIDVGPRPR